MCIRQGIVSNPQLLWGLALAWGSAEAQACPVKLALVCHALDLPIKVWMRGALRGLGDLGDRTWWRLPTYPVMADISDRSGLWCQLAYQSWQAAGPLEKSLVECQPPADLQDPRYARLEARALGMLIESVPARIKEELVVTRGMTCSNALFRILIAYQPGGLGERQKLIQSLTEPGVAVTAKCADKLRKWHRWLARSRDVTIAVPDAAVLLSGLDKLSAGILGAHPQLSFRCSMSRTHHQLDFCPSVATVTAYARLLQAEMDTLAISGLDCEVSGDKSGKRARAARMEGQPTGRHNHPNKSLGQNPPPTQHGNRPDAKAQEGKGEDPKAGNGKGKRKKQKEKEKTRERGCVVFS